jgi:subtilisin family serine protease
VSAPSLPRSVIRTRDIAGVAEMWAETTGDPSIRIALIDGSVDTSHPSLAAASIRHIDRPPFHRTVDDGWSLRHGTQVASIVLGQHGTEVEGLAPSCSGLVVPVFRDVGGRPAIVSQLDMARAILYALEQGARVINISGGQPDPTGRPEPLLADALRECESHGTLVVAAAGNDGRDVLHVPASYESVLAVGATDVRGVLLPLSNWGDEYSTHGVLAPGDEIVCARPGGGITTGTGTSYAAAVVAGLAALMLSAASIRGQSLSPLEARQALVHGAMGRDGGPLDGSAHPSPAHLRTTGAHGPSTRGVGAVADSVVASGDEAAGTSDEGFAGLLIPEPGDLALAQLAVGPTAVGPVVPDPTWSGAVPPTVGGGPGTCTTCADPAGGTAVQEAQLVYAIGGAGYDLKSFARRDSLSQHMGDATPDAPDQLLGYLDANPWESESVEWTMTLGETPVYALRPEGAYAREGYDRLRQGVREYLDGQVERISVAGVIVGQTQLMNGQVVPVVRPEPRCSYTWTTSALLQAVAGQAPDAAATQEQRASYDARVDSVGNFLERAYEDFRNLGITPAERALNFAATNAMNVANVFATALQRDTQLDSVSVERSPVCPPDSDCWDVNLTFFNPSRQFEQARQVYKFTVNVIDVCPVMVGRIRTWAVR